MCGVGGVGGEGEVIASDTDGPGKVLRSINTVVNIGGRYIGRFTFASAAFVV